jgi:predicted negative regulator of RcsB-dependent stress response
VSDLNEQEQWELAKQKVRELWIYVVGGVAIGLAVLGGWNWWKERRVMQAETASARYQELIQAFGRNDATRGMTLLADLKNEYGWTPYPALGSLIAARSQVEDNELDQAAASLRFVMDNAHDEELKVIARMRLARVLSAQGKHDDALALLQVAEAGEFAPRLADTRGDVLLAKGDRDGALREYLAARATPNNDGRVDFEMLDLKIRDLGGTPPDSSSGAAPGTVPAETPTASNGNS